MDESKETKVEQAVLDSQQAKELLYAYDMMTPKFGMRDLLANLLSLTRKARWVATDDANEITQQRGRNRGTYGGRSRGRMTDPLSADANKEVEDLSMEFVTSAINNFLSKYPTEPDKSTRNGYIAWKDVMVLFVQLVTTHGDTLLSGINIPDYVKPKLEAAQEYLRLTADTIWIDWLHELTELGNGHLIKYIESIGTSIFGEQVETDAASTWKHYMDPYLTTIVKPIDTKALYLKYRDKFSRVTSNINAKDIVRFFDITEDIRVKSQKHLYNEFKKNYMNDLDSQYLKILINGTED